MASEPHSDCNFASSESIAVVQIDCVVLNFDLTCYLSRNKAVMKLLPQHCNSARQLHAPIKSAAKARHALVPNAAAATQLSPKECGTENAKNQLEALKQMSKVVADSGVRKRTHLSRYAQSLYSCLACMRALN